LQGEAGLGKIFYLSENMMLAYYALSFSLNVLATVLIAARLYWHKVQLERVFGEHHHPNVRNVSANATLFLVTSTVRPGSRCFHIFIPYSVPRIRRLPMVLGSRMESPYMSIATILIESAALYGAWSLVFLILCIRQSPGQTIILATMGQIQVSCRMSGDPIDPGTRGSNLTDFTS
jgi:hypothetical protein